MEMAEYRKKLIEVALPLEAINVASAREKSIRHGHPSTLHLWWARRPLAAARAVLFAQLVDDPSSRPERFPTEEAQDAERQRLFRLIEQLVLWENTTNETVLAEAREEIWKSWRDTCTDHQDDPRAAELYNPDKLPAFHDPFAGGGSIPLEAQRLGLEAYASDLNPVAVLINKAMIEIPPKFAGQPPVNPEDRKRGMGTAWKGAAGLAADVRYYGKWMRDEAEKRIGHLYPKVEITAEMAQDRPDLKPLVGRKLTPVAWLWARTVKSPNPAFANVDVPLVSSYWLSVMKGKETWVEPILRPNKSGYDFAVRLGGSPVVQETVNRQGGVCLVSNAPITFAYGTYSPARREDGESRRKGRRWPERRVQCSE
jgi:putative DNA methylase